MRAAYCLLLTQTLLRRKTWCIAGCFGGACVEPSCMTHCLICAQSNLGFAVHKKRLQIWFLSLKMKKQRAAIQDV